jgi:hemin uptake protein HemP
MSARPDPQHSGQPAPPQPSASSDVRTLESQDLLQGQALVLIRHQGEVYRLQSTRQGKLILTK